MAEEEGVVMVHFNENITMEQSIKEDIRVLATEEYRKLLDSMDNSKDVYVNAHISNISFPTNIEELEVFVYEHGMYNLEEVLLAKDNCWTVPASSKIGDIVLFYHAKTAIARITALITKVHSLEDGEDYEKDLLLEWLERARGLFKIYGGKVFAIGRVTGSPEYWGDEEESYHWRGRIYADVGDIVVLENPIDISEFNDFIKISRQSGITLLPAKEFRQLREIMKQKNVILPAYFLRCEIGDYQLSQIDKHNFLEVTQMYRRRFLQEIDFRSYYVDYLLNALVERKFYRECTCYTQGKPNYFVDNVFLYNDRYYLLEVKLNIRLERDLVGQLKQYTDADYLYLNKQETRRIEDFERNFMYVIDTYGLYRYDRQQDELKMLIDLDEVKKIEDILQFI